LEDVKKIVANEIAKCIIAANYRYMTNMLREKIVVKSAV